MTDYNQYYPAADDNNNPRRNPLAFAWMSPSERQRAYRVWVEANLEASRNTLSAAINEGATQRTVDSWQKKVTKLEVQLAKLEQTERNQYFAQLKKEKRMAQAH